MNILFVATVYNHLAVFHKPFIKYFQQKGCIVHVAGSNSMGLKSELEDLGVICHDINFDKKVFSKNNYIAIKQLKSLFNNLHFDLIHVHTPIAAFLVRFVLKNNRQQGSLVYTAHGFHFFKGAPLKNWLIYYTAEKIASKWLDHLITINEEDYRNAQKIGIDKSDLSLVHGVGVEFYEENHDKLEITLLKSELNILDDTIVIGYIAELNKNKNHEFLLKNWKRVKEEIPNSVLLIIGTGELEKELKEYVIENSLKDIKFLGYRKDIFKLLKLVDIITLLSHREGLPKSIMEAMVEQIPCVVTDTRGLRDLIQNGENGFVVEHSNDEQLCSSFCALKSKKLRSEMGKVSQQRIQPYLMDNVLKEYDVIYSKLLSK